MIEVERLAGAGHVRRAFDSRDEENRRFRGRCSGGHESQSEQEKEQGQPAHPLSMMTPPWAAWTPLHRSFTQLGVGVSDHVLPRPQSQLSARWRS